MSQDEQENSLKITSETPPACLGRPGFLIFYLMLLAIGGITTVGLLMAKKPLPAEEKTKPGIVEDAPAKELKEFAAKYFPAWPANRKPEVVLFFSGEQHNYEAPCGCTEPQFGGLERRYNFITEMRKLGLKVVAMDLGDIYYKGLISDQSRLKFQYSMQALNLMGYDAITVGPEELRYPLWEALANTVLQKNYPYAILGANIMPKEQEFPGEKKPSMLDDFRVVEPKDCKIKVGVVGTLGETAIKSVAKLVIPEPDPDEFKKKLNAYFGNNGVVLPQVLKAMKPKNPDVNVLLYQGTEEEAKSLAKALPDFDIILHRSAESEPPRPSQVGKTHLVAVGHKGRLIGIMGLFRNAAGGLDYHWDLVPLGKEFATAKDLQKSNPSVQLLEDYTKEVKDKDMMGRFPQVPHPLQARFANVKYVGSDACKNCHAAEWNVWNASRHAAAIETLSENPKAYPPHNRRFDAECLICHTTGLGYDTGFTSEKKTPHLVGVGCETCHGPGSAHAANQNNKDLTLAMSPWKVNKKDSVETKAVENRVFAMCIKCHDMDNDHDFDFKKWKKIAHGAGANKKAGGK